MDTISRFWQQRIDNAEKDHNEGLVALILIIYIVGTGIGIGLAIYSFVSLDFDWLLFRVWIVILVFWIPFFLLPYCFPKKK